MSAGFCAYWLGRFSDASTRSVTPNCTGWLGRNEYSPCKAIPSGPAVLNDNPNKWMLSGYSANALALPFPVFAATGMYGDPVSTLVVPLPSAGNVVFLTEAIGVRLW